MTHQILNVKLYNHPLTPEKYDYTGRVRLSGTMNIVKVRTCVVAILCVILAGSFYSCQKDEFDNGSLKVGAITEIKLGETAKNPKYGLSLSVENVKNAGKDTIQWEDFQKRINNILINK